MANPVLYKSEDDAVRAAAASMSFEAQQSWRPEQQLQAAPDAGKLSDEEARKRLDSIMKDISGDWRNG